MEVIANIIIHLPIRNCLHKIIIATFIRRCIHSDWPSIRINYLWVYVICSGTLHHTPGLALHLPPQPSLPCPQLCPQLRSLLSSRQQVRYVYIWYLGTSICVGVRIGIAIKICVSVYGVSDFIGIYCPICVLYENWIRNKEHLLVLVSVADLSADWLNKTWIYPYIKFFRFRHDLKLFLCRPFVKSDSM